MGEVGQPITGDLGQQMMGHVFLIKHGGVVGNRTGGAGGDVVPVGESIGDDGIATGVDEARGLEVVSVERLVPDGGVGTVFPRSHHRGGDVAGPRPHGEPDTHLRGADSAQSRAMRAW